MLHSTSSTTSQSPRLDDGPVRNGCVFDYDDNAASDDKAQLFPVRLLHVVFIHELYIAPDACVFVDDGSSDCGVGADCSRNFSIFLCLLMFSRWCGVISS